MWPTRSLSSLFFLSLALCTAANSQPEKRYAILDNDWGAISFLPFLIALKNDIQVLGLVSDTANSWQRQCAYHALANLEVGNLSCIPVYAGATYPLINTPVRFQAWESVHGKLPWEGAFASENVTAEALGNDPTSGDPNRIVKAAFVEGFPTTKINHSTSAANFMVEMVHKYPHQVSIYSAGALTNIALAVRMDPDFASLAKELVIMGGYVDVNMYQVTGDYLQADINSDINLMIDPEAAKIALNAEFPEIVIAGNVANQVQSTQDYLDEVYTVKNEYTRLFHDHYGTEFPFWDETAAALMVDRSLAINTTTAYIDVDISYGSPNYGNIHVYQAMLKPPGVRNITYVNRIDGAKLKDMMKQAMWKPPTCS
ncbi:Inosine/uridine-preferring nucleoside hydrolase domain-containing protein [Aspergillus pseudonomiae]|uniref:Inosine/uridine-preferring nucleoside hydrolase domain-containing protein n=1 Tax=Aspergillus pseudonomiae TaxID=1506151 RepID=A0A5N7DEK2_9EURO|nr:Inosine/uridine-preferring nucleoside hydrolase domain-containing protein [Aspergillus pseudonomiae]KAB8254435.1 Inosine/uridine-preferring nucleoside hydrolase domain-containing protein [Aspergillus pseudonomiae]KAE8404615.1 Inosine/uridine-preferring nucleoside hydrolase domain-containing protein [Aspergillus pseudonomiae]